MGKFITLIYGVIAYAIFFGSFLYAIGFVGNVLVPKSVDSGVAGPFGRALLINALLLGVFAIQHSVMARQGFKKMWTKIVPEPAERSTYVLLSSLALFLLYWQWQPMQGVIWSVENPTGALFLQGLFWLGWVIVLLSTFMIDHFDLFGLRQVYDNLLGKATPQIVFKSPALYKIVRHPIYMGFMIAFWATPVMTVGHFVFAFATTAYMVVGVWFEERDLVRIYGAEYENYRKQVRMFVPLPGKK
ncbi:MAG: isoprenylcysteine carboxylmethyltransferase family protein [candidate division Zixibacteria bacterium]